MAMHLRRTVLIVLTAVYLWPSPARLVADGRTTARVEPLFNLSGISGAPFPSDLFTVSDETQNTGLRVNLPKPDCATVASDECIEIDLLNEMDGFHVWPRVSIPFSGPIDPGTVTTKTVFLVPLGNSMTSGDEDDSDGDGRPISTGKIVGLNQVVWDVETHSLHGTADEILEQHSRYGLIVTRGVRDTSGNPVEPSIAFERFRHDLNFGQTRDPVLRTYRKSLLRALTQASGRGIHSQDIAVASVFTTQSVSAVLEKIRDQIKASTPEPADLNLAGGEAPTIFRLNDVVGITLREQIAVNPPRFTTIVPRLPMLRIIPDAVETLAAGKFTSRVYTRDHLMPAIGTRTGAPEVHGTEDVHFTVFLPPGRPGVGGWPVVIFGDGQPGGNPWSTSFNIAAVLAAHGLATVSIQPAWHGFGPLSTVTVRLTNGSM